MAQWHLRSHRTPTGALLHPTRKKRRADRGSLFLEPTIKKTSRKQDRVLGGNRKVRLLGAETANVMNPKTHTCAVTKILTVSGNPANPNYVRRNVLTKGALIKTELGVARITSRPGQEGAINAVLLEKEK